MMQLTKLKKNLEYKKVKKVYVQLRTDGKATG